MMGFDRDYKCQIIEKWRVDLEVKYCKKDWKDKKRRTTMCQTSIVAEMFVASFFGSVG